MKRKIEAEADHQAIADLHPVLLELDAIKRLLVLLLMKAGSSQREIAKALGVNQTAVSRQFGMGKVDPAITEVINRDEDR